MKHTYTLFRRKGQKYWYFYFYEGKNRIARSTGKMKKYAAEEYADEYFKKDSVQSISFRDYAESFFIWEYCPHVMRLREEGKNIGKTHVQKCRRWLEQYVFTDRQLVHTQMGEITRADLLDYRTRLMKKLGDKRNTVNKVMSVIKTIFKEAFFRQDIKYDPTQGIGNVKEDRHEPGIFPAQELKELFPSNSYGPWKDIKDYTCFLVATTTGMRKSEILALRWCDISLSGRMITISRAWKSEAELGPPKWGKKRIVPLPEITVSALESLKEESIRIAPKDLTFCYDDGSRLGTTWWTKHFIQAMDRARINRKARNLKPHSFRHTLNTLLRNAGQDPAKIRASLGWSQERTQENYTHWQIDHLRGQADIINEFFNQ